VRESVVGRHSQAAPPALHSGAAPAPACRAPFGRTTRLLDRLLAPLTPG
jgi:hypothetical protein